MGKSELNHPEWRIVRKTGGILPKYFPQHWSYLDKVWKYENILMSRGYCRLGFYTKWGAKRYIIKNKEPQVIWEER